MDSLQQLALDTGIVQAVRLYDTSFCLYCGSKTKTLLGVFRVLRHGRLVRADELFGALRISEQEQATFVHECEKCRSHKYLPPSAENLLSEFFGLERLE